MRARPLFPVVLCGSLLLAACGTNDPQADCPSVSAPGELTLASLSPALGAELPNQSIVHEFSLPNGLLIDSIALSYPAEHSAGAPNPELQFSYSVGDSTTQYTADPVEWERAPGHVEIEAPLVYQTDVGCAYRLPSPLFSYDITP